MMADVEFEPLHGENEEEAEFILEKRSGIILLTKHFSLSFTHQKKQFLYGTRYFLEKDCYLKSKSALLHSDI